MQQDERTIYGKFMGGKIIINLIVLAFFYVVFPDGGQFDFVATQFFPSRSFRLLLEQMFEAA